MKKKNWKKSDKNTVNNQNFRNAKNKININKMQKMRKNCNWEKKSKLKKRKGMQAITKKIVKSIKKDV